MALSATATADTVRLSFPKKGSEVNAALEKRFGTSFANPQMRGRYIQAARRALGLPQFKGEFEAGQAVNPMFADEAAFVAEVQRIVQTL